MREIWYFAFLIIIFLVCLFFSDRDMTVKP